MDVKKVGERLKELRTAAGVTQETMAEAMDVSEVTIRRIERGEGLHMRHVLAFSKILGLTLQEVFDLEQELESPSHARLHTIFQRLEQAPDEVIALACDLMETLLTHND